MSDVPAGPRVLYATQGFPRWDGDPSAPFVMDHCRALLDAGASVRVLCPSAPELPTHDRVGPVDVVRFRYAPRRLETLAYSGAMHRQAKGLQALLLPFFLLGFLAGAVREAKEADVIHAFWWIPSGLVAVVAGWLTGVPVVVHILGTDAAMTRGPLRPLARFVLRWADEVESMSTDLARWCKDVSGVDARVAPMPLGAAQRPEPTPPPADGPVLGVGRLVPEKGFDQAVRAAAISGLPLELVGGGDQRDALEALAGELGADVRFAGPLPPAEVAAKYAAARLVVVPSRREGFGMVAAEAAAAGRAVVAFDVGGLSDTVGPTNGALVPAGDVEALAAALATTDPALGANGPAVVAYLAPDRVAAGALAAYDRIIPSGRRPMQRPLVLAVSVVLVAAILALCASSLAEALRDAGDLDLSWTAGPLLRSGAWAIGAGLLLASTWTGLVRALGPRLGWLAGARIWWTGALGRYLPTGLGALPARVVVARRVGLATAPALRATAVEAAALPLGCLLLWLVTVVEPFGAVLALLGFGLGVLAVRRSAAVAVGPAAAYLAGVVAQIAMRALAVGSLVALTGERSPSVATLAGAVGGSYLLGLLAVFAPAGLGVREALLATALAPSIGAPAAAAVAIAWRVVESVVELVLVAGTHLAHRVVTALRGDDDTGGGAVLTPTSPESDLNGT